ncbi:hypothetical protein [Arthrobacter caoxuetaonis]|uniref:hypothetical protein n=1 Tax=Arthrobacter caoxuetaonis TaxID=2886935 RepID=UPI001D15DBB5|nr:hypothetical protein [Arthrobacter caoxuetaonis]MCC3284111.1 hypothetical protein [Arthrobacter caoxuetaonis]
MDERLPHPGKSAANSPGGPAHSEGAGAPPRTPRSPLRLIVTVLAALLALAGVASLAALLLEALRGESVWPGFAAGAFYALPIAFVLMAGLVIDSIVRRRRG